MNPGIFQQGSSLIPSSYNLLGRPSIIPMPNQYSSGFDPTTIGTLTAWYDFSDLSSLTIVNNLISSINNKFGIAPTLTQSVEANRPSINQINGRIAALFDGVNDFLVNAPASVQSFGTIFTVTGPISSTDRTVVHFCRFPGAVEAMAVGTNNTGAQFGVAGRWAGTGGINISTNSGHAAFSSYVISATFDRFSSPKMKTNGSFQSINIGGINNGNQPNISIGARNVNGVYLSYWNSTIGEILLYPSILSNDQILAVELYLIKKWGVP